MFHELTLVGRLGREPEMRYLADGRPVTSMNIATDRVYKNQQGEQVKEVCWFRVSAFGPSAESCAQYLHKGSPVFVKGFLRPDAQTGGPRIWTRQDGTPGASYDLVATTIKFLPAGRAAEADTAAPPVEDFEGVPDTRGAEEIPF